MMNWIENFLSKYTTVGEILSVGLIAACVYSLNTNIENTRHSVKWDAPLIHLTEKERFYLTDDSDIIRWCELNQDCSVLAEAIVYEARGESEVGRASVAHTILNRVVSSRWGDDVPSVVYEPHQFSYTMKEQRTKPKKSDWISAKLLAAEIMKGYIESPVKDATHFHTTDVHPYWANKLEYIVTIDKHKFYR